MKSFQNVISETNSIIDCEFCRSRRRVAYTSFLKHSYRSKKSFQENSNCCLPKMNQKLNNSNPETNPEILKENESKKL